MKTSKQAGLSQKAKLSQTADPMTQSDSKRLGFQLTRATQWVGFEERRQKKAEQRETGSGRTGDSQGSSLPKRGKEETFRKL